MKNQVSKKKVPEEIVRDFYKVLGPKLPSIIDSMTVVWDEKWDGYRLKFKLKDSIKERYRPLAMTEYNFEKFLHSISDNEMAKDALDYEWIRKISLFYRDLARYFDVPVYGGLYE